MILLRQITLQSVLSYELRDGTLLVRSEPHPRPQERGRRGDRFR